MDLLSTKDTATRLGLHVNTLRRYVKAGQLVAVRIGNRLKFKPEVIDAFVEARTVQN